MTTTLPMANVPTFDELAARRPKNLACRALLVDASQAVSTATITPTA